jgi:triosephosphate isomerase
VPARRRFVAGNWKMNETVGEARALALGIRDASVPAGVDVVLCPPFTALQAVGEVLQGSLIGLGAQNMHAEASGAFTGEISAPMLRDLGVRWVILGHSERRRYFCETDEGVAHKVQCALRYGMVPIVAVGETAEEHAAGETIERVRAQTRAAFQGLGPSLVAGCIVAYEPIWAIGTGNVDAPASANAVMGAIRASVAGLEDARIIYGGSMKPDNAASLAAEPNIDGGLIGGASLQVGSFVALIHAAHPDAG